MNEQLKNIRYRQLCVFNNTEERWVLGMLVDYIDTLEKRIQQLEEKKNE
jgi:hypothetical protein